MHLKGLNKMNIRKCKNLRSTVPVQMTTSSSEVMERKTSKGLPVKQMSKIKINEDFSNTENLKANEGRLSLMSPWAKETSQETQKPNDSDLPAVVSVKELNKGHTGCRFKTKGAQQR